MSYTIHIALQQRPVKNERTIRINQDETFATLAQAICASYGFDGEHLREFIQKHKLCINHPEISIDTPIDTDIFGEDEDLNDPELLELGDNTLQVSATTYTLDQFFSSEKEIIFAYDFLAGWQFTITKEAEDTKKNNDHPRTVISGTGTYLLEDCGGPAGLQEQIDLYLRHKFDEDLRETFEDFAEWIEPACQQFTIPRT